MRPWIHLEHQGLPGLLEPDREFWRYYFAGQALAGVNANPEAVKRGVDRQERAERALCDADALLAELEREPREGGETP